MKIKESFVDQFRDVRALRKIAERFERNDLLDVANELSSELWEGTRSYYNLPSDVKFSIELDGDLVGELRIKGTGKAYIPMENSQ